MIKDVKKNIEKYPEVEFKIINTDNKGVIREYGISRGIMMNGKPLIKRMASWSEIKSCFEKRLKNI